MKKIVKLSLFLLLISILLISGCSKTEPKTGDAVYDVTKSACEKAQAKGTCQTKLVELNIITPAECCSRYNKCC